MGDCGPGIHLLLGVQVELLSVVEHLQGSAVQAPEMMEQVPSCMAAEQLYELRAGGAWCMNWVLAVHSV